jgi:hypothetical protein
MHPSQDHLEDDAELPDVDSRTLVTALTQQLILRGSTPPLEAEEQGETAFHNLIDRNLIDRTVPQSDTSTADATLREITSSSSVAVFRDKETSLPVFP